jgi:hypothetical protein
MLDVLMLFPASADSRDLDAFVSGFGGTLERAPGLRSLKVSDGDLMSPGGPPPFSAVLEASFGSLADWMAVVQAPKSQSHQDLFTRLAPLVLYFEVRDQ